MEKVTLTGYIIIPDAELETVQAALAIHIDLTREEEGCLVFEVTQDSVDSHKFNVYEEFVDQQSFDAHQDRVRSSKWGAVSKNLTRHYTIDQQV